MHALIFETFGGPDLKDVLTTAAIRRGRANAFFANIRASALQPTIAARFPLSERARAHAFLESRTAIGKVLLTL